VIFNSANVNVSKWMFWCSPLKVYQN